MEKDCKYILYDKRWLPEIKLIYPRIYESYQGACIARSKALKSGKYKLTDIQLSEVTKILQSGLENWHYNIVRPLMIDAGYEELLPKFGYEAPAEKH